MPTYFLLNSLWWSPWTIWLAMLDDAAKAARYD
jgi:hypothetical protein